MVHAGIGVVAGVLATIVACTSPAEPSGRLSLLFGYRDMTDGSWGSLGGQPVLRTEFEGRGADWPVSIVSGFGAGVARDEIDEGRTCFIICFTNTTELEGHSIDAYLGLKRGFEFADFPIRPYVGGGGAVVFSKFDVYMGRNWTESESFTNVGGYLQAGLALVLAPESGISGGLELRSFFGDSATASGHPVDSDFHEVTLFVSKVW